MAVRLLVKPALTDRQWDVVKQWKSYAADLVVYCEELFDYGVGTEKPKKSKISLDAVLKDGRSKQNDLTGDKLHQYLLQYIVEKQSHVLIDCQGMQLNSMFLRIIKSEDLFTYNNRTLHLCALLSYMATG